MKKILIFGNSGSGKSTLAKKLCLQRSLEHLDLDTLAWENETPPARKPLNESVKAIREFTSSHSDWVIEGCYADLLDCVLADAKQVIFMNLPVVVCIANAGNRQWEPHKYESKAAQDANLPMLIEWISQYDNRADSFSKAAHMDLYQRFSGAKIMQTKNS
jgi:adenylate kinase family enzyme